jgi:hypothetical protein
MKEDMREQGHWLRQLLVGGMVLLFGVGSFVGGRYLFSTSSEAEHTLEVPRELSKLEPKQADLPAEASKPPDERPRKAAEAQFRSNEAQRKVAGSQREGELNHFQSAEGRFSVLLPGTPKKQNLSVSGISTTAYTIDEKDGAYVVVFADLPISAHESAQQTQLRLDGARDGMLRSTSARLTSESPLLLAGKYPGREINADLPERKGILRARLYIVGQRLYQILAAGGSTWAQSSQANQFLDSLAVTVEKSTSTTGSSPARRQRSISR